MRGLYYTTLGVLWITMLPGTVNAQASRNDEGSTPPRERGPRVVLMPGDNPFRALIADPKEQTFFASLLGVTSPSRGSRTGSVGIGATVGLVRWQGRSQGDGLQLGLSGGVFAQFDLTKKSNDLINADYLIGVPLTYRHGAYSARLRVYHQSSHLGDEFVENNDDVDRLNLSFESIEVLLSRDFGPVRAYGGGEYRFNRTPHDDLKHGVFHWGLEYRYPKPLLRVSRIGAVRPVLAVDLKSFEQRAWQVGWSGRLGVELGSLRGSGSGSRAVSFLFEVYDGPNPYGQFYFEDTTSIGFGAHFAY